MLCSMRVSDSDQRIVFQSFVVNQTQTPYNSMWYVDISHNEIKVDYL